LKKIKVAAGVILDHDNVLITRRAPKENFAGGWEFPGGKIEVNETPEACLVRELKEELNIEVSVDKFCDEATYDYGNMSINLVAYYCTITGGNIQMSVHDKCEWVKIDDLLTYDFLPADVTIANKVMEEYYEQF
jgi:8-oxo-dGTP diphosphatase